MTNNFQTSELLENYLANVLLIVFFIPIIIFLFHVCIFVNTIWFTHSPLLFLFFSLLFFLPC
jgi:hypothetical protein